MDLPSGSTQDSPEFYEKLLDNPQILARAGMESYGALTEGKTLAAYYRQEDDRPGITELKIVKRLQEDLDVSIDAKTGVVTVRVKAPSAALAQAINARLLGLLNEFNVSTRQSQARAEREFTQHRLSEVRDSLRAAEDRMQSFLQRNRDVRNSAELTFQQDRLARDLTLQQSIYTTLAQSYEKAKLDEVRDLPVLAPVLAPTLPPKGDARGTVQRAILGALLGAIFAFFVALWREARAAIANATTGDLATLRELLTKGETEAREVWGRFRRVILRRPAGP